MRQNSQTQKNKHLLFSYWDILPLLTLVCYIIAFAALRPKFPHLDVSGISPFANPDKTMVEFAVMAALVWINLSIIVFIGKHAMAIFIPMRSLVTTGLLLFGFALALRPTVGKMALGLGLGVFFLSIIIGLVVSLTMINDKEQDVPLDDPARCAEFWKGGDMFYFNGKDKRLFVPRLHQNTYSEFYSALNFGHKKAWIIAITPAFMPLLWIITQLIVSFIYHK